MSLKYTITTADYLDWKEMTSLVRNLYRDENYKFSLLIALGSFWGLRISDLLSLHWCDIYKKDSFIIKEKKTGKARIIKINDQLKRHITDCYTSIKPISKNSYIFLSQKGSVYSIQRINIVLKDIKQQYCLNINNFSCHSLRKTFGREVYNQNSDNAEMALIKLMELFNHSSIAITKRYLGLRQEELLRTYEELKFI
ncbi:tyrosine-type recombinase/integrase [Clostridium sp.]|uniref:tyrosine-type recombinase/integrase n=1 Tax=Clostridium sp. TaxID=1506 RepID=UPI003F660F11